MGLIVVDDPLFVVVDIHFVEIPESTFIHKKLRQIIHAKYRILRMSNGIVPLMCIKYIRCLFRVKLRSVPIQLGFLRTLNQRDKCLAIFIQIGAQNGEIRGQHPVFRSGSIRRGSNPKSMVIIPLVIHQKMERKKCIDILEEVPLRIGPHDLNERDHRQNVDALPSASHYVKFSDFNL